jgi:hypothetical protein
MTIRPFDARKRHVARQILGAMGLGAASLLAMSACTNEIIVLESSETTPTTPTTTPTHPPQPPPTLACNEPAYGYLEYACVPANGACPPGPELLGVFDEMLGGTCDDDPNNGCCWQYALDVPCGPDPGVVDACCYYVQMTQEQGCEGRPFAVQGETRVAPARRRADWCAALAPDVSLLDDRTRSALADAWQQDGLYEHASVASFARFVMELMAVGAPADMLRDAQRALGDEIRHAELCFGMASAYRGAPVGPGDLPIDGGLSERHDFASIAVATAIEGCINETLATLVAHASAAAARDTAVVATLDEIAADESRHAALAWRFVAWACRRDASARREVAKAFDEAAASGVGEDVTDVEVAEMRAHGQLDAAERRRVIVQGFADVVMPAARALIASCPSHDAVGEARIDEARIA